MYTLPNEVTDAIGDIFRQIVKPKRQIKVTYIPQQDEFALNGLKSTKERRVYTWKPF